MSKKSTQNQRSRKVVPDRPKKPYRDFPLTPHASGAWQKKIRGKTHYFGRWGKRVNGKLQRLPDDGWQEAVELYKAQADDLHAGRTPRVSNKDGLTVRELCNRFYTAKKRKLDAGAARAITQFVFDNDAYMRFRDRCARTGIDSALVPEILPITRFPQLTGFAETCGATVPKWLRERFKGLEEDAETRQLIAASVAIEQVQMLSKEGIDEFHFYTLNRSELTFAICHALGVRPLALAS